MRPFQSFEVVARSRDDRDAVDYLSDGFAYSRANPVGK
jgi:hypothetical protein